MKIANYDLPLERGWKFHLGEVKRFKDLSHDSLYRTAKAGGALGRLKTFLEENEWQSIRVPHDWLTEQPYDPDAAPSAGYKKRGVGWYYIKFDLPDAPIESARLVFEGVLGQTVVYVNGMVAARNFSGYNRFGCEVASYLLPDAENCIALFVDGTEWEGWSYEGAGLYRPVCIKFRDTVRLNADNCFVRGLEEQGTWRVVADLDLCSDAEEKGVTVCAKLEAPDGGVIAQVERPAARSLTLSLPVENPVLWSPESPVLYRFSCVLMRDGERLDGFEGCVGLRSITWCPDAGMYLNGSRYRIKGACCHQDHGGVGAAVTPALMEYRIMRLKALGINAYRCAHHAVSATLLEICDRLGMLVMVENRHFSVSEDVLGQLEALVRVARNHPSVFIYSLFNEEPWQGERRGYLMARQMRALVRSLDDTRAVTGAMNGGTLSECNAADALDVVGMNYGLARYEATHARFPNKAILGTENCPTYATRGEYVTDHDRQVFAAYGDEWAKLFSESMEETMMCAQSLPYNAGCFIWSGFDAYGEPNPHLWPSVMSHWGVMDICGFQKDTAHLLAAWYKEELCAHLLPHWNHRVGETVRVCVFTNAECAELFVNGRSQGERQVVGRRAEWSVPFEAGALHVCARRGGEVIFDQVQTAGAPSVLHLEDVTPLGDKPEIRILNLCVTDRDGTPIPDCARPVQIICHGTEVLGVANGDPNAHLSKNCDTVPLFHARAQVIVAAERGYVIARCAGLPEVRLDI